MMDVRSCHVPIGSISDVVAVVLLAASIVLAIIEIRCDMRCGFVAGKCGRDRIAQRKDVGGQSLYK